jgi:hypothetical protein
MTDLTTRRELHAEATIDREHNAHMHDLYVASSLSALIGAVDPAVWPNTTAMKAHLVACSEAAHERADAKFPLVADGLRMAS